MKRLLVTAITIAMVGLISHSVNAETLSKLNLSINGRDAGTTLCFKWDGGLFPPKQIDCNSFVLNSGEQLYIYSSIRVDLQLIIQNLQILTGVTNANLK